MTTSGTKRGRGMLRMQHPYRKFFMFLFAVALFLVIMAFQMLWAHNNNVNKKDQGMPHGHEAFMDTTLTTEKPTPTNHSCLFHSCFDVYHCGYNDDNRISVYIYPPLHFLDADGNRVTLPMSSEFHEILSAIRESVYYTPDPDKACLFVPMVDVLNQNHVDIELTAKVLSSLPYWNGGTNHLLWNMLPGTAPDYNSSLDVPRGRAILAGGGFSSWTYRRTYDVSIPVFNPLVRNVHLPQKPDDEQRPILLISTQLGVHAEYRQEMDDMAERYNTFLRLDRCNHDGARVNVSQRCAGDRIYDYPHVLQEATFCLVLRGARLGQAALSDAIMAGCIPVIVADSYVLPFSETLDWTRAALVVEESHLSGVVDVVAGVSAGRVASMRRQGAMLWQQYLGSPRALALAALNVLNARVFPYATPRAYQDWNDPVPADKECGVQSPLFLPLMAPQQAGFTAVILTYDRQDMLFKVIQQVALLPSLAKVLVVWNNQLKPPPPAANWPKISKPLKVVQTRYNKLSNRFYPYDEIETEAILALDDDILMLTTDELEFGYEVWREFPDRLVGFPSRLHLWDNVTGSWKYESEWTSAISMVLTGAAFHHKYYSYLYTNTLPGNIKAWVDEHMNCEDIAMNFLIANTTGKPPIKVAPRQKFKCPECVNQGMLSADMGHMVERSECINTFARIYGMMPLKTVEFRADPVLYKDSLPDELKKYCNMGHL